MMHSIVPTLDQLTPTGDHARDSTAALFDYHRDYLQVLMGLYPNNALSGVAKSLLAQSSVPEMQNSFMFYSDYLYDHVGILARPLTSTANGLLGQRHGSVFDAVCVEQESGIRQFYLRPLYRKPCASRSRQFYPV